LDRKKSIVETFRGYFSAGQVLDIDSVSIHLEMSRAAGPRSGTEGRAKPLWSTNRNCASLGRNVHFVT